METAAGSAGLTCFLLISLIPLMLQKYRNFKSVAKVSSRNGSTELLSVRSPRRKFGTYKTLSFLTRITRN